MLLSVACFNNHLISSPCKFSLGISLDILHLLFFSGKWIRKQSWKLCSTNMFAIISFRCFFLIFTRILFKISLVIMSTLSPKVLMGSDIKISSSGTLAGGETAELLRESSIKLMLKPLDREYLCYMCSACAHAHTRLWVCVCSHARTLLTSRWCSVWMGHEQLPPPWLAIILLHRGLSSALGNHYLCGALLCAIKCRTSLS